MTVKIISFNVKNLSDGIGRDLNRIAQIINENEADIVCLQEVLQEGKIIEGIQLKQLSGQAAAYDRSLKRRLKGEWDSEWKEPKLRRENEAYLGGDKRGEGYAILWKKDKFTLPKDEYGQEVRPVIYSNYKPGIVGSKIGLIRDPLYARFILKDRPAELRIISVHFVSGKSKNLTDVLDYGAIEMRKQEFKMVAGQIYYRVSEMYKQIDCTSPYTIMLGDYNLNLGTSLPLVMGFDKKGRSVDVNNSSFRVHNLQNEKTTLKNNLPELANSYDHFTVDTRTKSIIAPESISVIDGIHKHGGTNTQNEEENFNVYREKVSDHLPIIVTVNL